MLNEQCVIAQDKKQSDKLKFVGLFFYVIIIIG